MFKFYQKILLQQFKGLNRITPSTFYNGFASATIAEAKNVNGQSISEDDKPINAEPTTARKDNKMIKTVFASLQLEASDHIQTPCTDSKLINAQTIDELLSLSEGSGISRKHALKVVSVLSNWTSSNKVTLSDFESDPRFIKLCRILTKTLPGSKYNRPITTATSKSEDLSTVLSVTADEEAAKLVESITLVQMVKVLTTLSIKRRRSTLLLRTLAYNIAGSSEKLDIKQCADLLYSISSLNFYDDNLFERVSNNVISILQVENIRRSAVIGSILTSVGLLKYKNPGLLDAISEWVIKNQTHCRPQDIFSLFMTLAVLNYVPSNGEHLFKVLVPQLTQSEAGKPGVWLEMVWSLVLLNQANSEHIKSVLDDTFINNLRERNSLNTSAILKLLNIDGAGHYLIENYDGPKIPKDHDIRRTNLLMTKEKSEIVASVIDALKNLIPESYFRTRIATGLGFFIDAECFLDKKCNPIPLNAPETDEKIKIAILTYDYHDICKGKMMDLTGVHVLSQRLLSAMGYRIVSILYTDFKPTDKIVNRVQYLENQLKEAVKQPVK